MFDYLQDSNISCRFEYIVPTCQSDLFHRLNYPFLIYINDWINLEASNFFLMDMKLNPGDSVMDIRQFLLDAPETCFFTCYDLLLHTKDGSTHHLEDFNEISEVADITNGGCSLEMVPGIYLVSLSFCA